MFKMIKNMDRRIKIYLGTAAGTILLLIFLLIILKISVGVRITSKKFETRLKDAAVNYYKKEKKKLPKVDGEQITITIDDLVTEGYLKDPDKLLKKNVTCTGGVNVSNNNGYYLYQPVIDCSDGYKTNLLYKKILEDNPTKTSGDGLYKINDYYLFRGENLNNYVQFAGKNWQILRINSDNTIRIILIDSLEAVPWDNRYNIEKKDSAGKNDFEVSRIKQTLIDYFSNKKGKLFTKDDKALMVPTQLCIGSKNELSEAMDGAIECSKKSEKLPIGLLQVNEYPIVSLDKDCKKLYDSSCRNYNFLAKLYTFWTITADSKSTYEVYKIDSGVDSVIASTYSQPRMVINITSDALYKNGKGTSDNPYIIK